MSTKELAKSIFEQLDEEGLKKFILIFCDKEQNEREDAFQQLQKMRKKHF